MTTPFHIRFDIEVPIEEARRRFVNRMREFTEMVIDSCKESPRSMIMQLIKVKLGEKQGYFRDESGSEFMRHWNEFVKEDFWNCLRITEEMYYVLTKVEREAVSTFNKQVSGLLDWPKLILKFPGTLVFSCAKALLCLTNDW